MKCEKCGISVNEAMLYRTSPFGETAANWWCMPCIEKYESELAKNIKEDTELTNIGRIIQGKSDKLEKDVKEQ